MSKYFSMKYEWTDAGWRKETCMRTTYMKLQRTTYKPVQSTEREHLRARGARRRGAVRALRDRPKGEQRREAAERTFFCEAWVDEDTWRVAAASG
eukprot:6210176-Pleurochrysis_carterae.AAC.5